MTTLLVSAAGGHLTQLVRLASRLDVVDDQQVWVTPRTPQSESLLAGRTVEFVPNIPERDLRGVVRSIAHARELVKRLRPTAAVSTGSGIALGYLISASLANVPSYYIESATRSTGPSRTGRILSHWSRVKVFTQHPARAGRRWKYVGSVFDEFEPRVERNTPEPLRVVVTIGSSDWQFDRLLRHVKAIAPADASIVWQIGSSTFRDLPGEVHDFLPASELNHQFRRAHVVIAHAGCGSALAALDSGRIPILVPRTVEHGEILDDHQGALSAALAERGLAIAKDVHELKWADVAQAASLSATAATTSAPINVAS